MQNQRPTPACFKVKPGFADGLCSAADCDIWSSAIGADGLCRLQRQVAVPSPDHCSLPAIPLKKLLLPEGEPVWSWDGTAFTPPKMPAPAAVFGVTICDLQALWYLDRVFSDDAPYRLRRERLLVVGSPCQPTDCCSCAPERLPLGGDLFWSGDLVWVLSEKGRDILKKLDHVLADLLDHPLPQPGICAHRVVQPDETVFHGSAGSPVWQEQGGKCLACGACSAVCPTCYCYDMIDTVNLEGRAIRHRVWDNCFFADHARVAGGHDFRAGLAERLRFRFEHKKIGFGPLRGTPSCVGCGRCLKACPVGIDLDRIAEQIFAGCLPC
jgi:ferredoxin